MSSARQRWFLVAKIGLAAVLIAAVGWKFAELLDNPVLKSQLRFRIELLVPAGLLYLACHILWGTFWVQLLRGQGVAIPWLVGLRAYFVSQFGKYVPGKAWVLLLRIGLLDRADVKPTVVVVTGAYETLTNMAAGAIFGAMLLPWSGLFETFSRLQVYGLFSLALLPLGLLGLNRLVRRVARKYRSGAEIPVPSPWLLLRGLLQAMLGWALLGLSLWLTLGGVAGELPPLSPSSYAQYLCGVCLSYVIGFVVLFAPAGAGAREWVLQVVLTKQLGDDAEALTAAIAVVLRIVWTIAEVIAAVALYLLVKPKSPDEQVRS